MDMWEIMRGAGMISWLRESIIRSWISAQDLQWVDFTSKESLGKLAERIMPKLLKQNPQIAQRIKNSGWLDAQTKEKVTEVIDANTL